MNESKFTSREAANNSKTCENINTMVDGTNFILEIIYINITNAYVFYFEVNKHLFACEMQNLLLA